MYYLRYSSGVFISGGNGSTVSLKEFIVFCFGILIILALFIVLVNKARINPEMIRKKSKQAKPDGPEHRIALHAPTKSKQAKPDGPEHLILEAPCRSRKSALIFDENGQRIMP